MEQYFEQFEEKLQVAEEKLDILSEWYIAKGHKGATEIAEECRETITSLWIEFYKLSEAYKQAEASHEEFYQANVDNLLGELRKHDNEKLETAIFLSQKRPQFLLFDYLAKGQELFEERSVEHPTTNVWRYLLSLVRKDLKERGLL